MDGFIKVGVWWVTTWCVLAMVLGINVAHANTGFNHNGYYATVTNVTANNEYVTTQDKVCEKQVVKIPSGRDSLVGGADGLVGGIIGGVIGNQFGKGDGKAASTALGAIIGNRMATAGKPEYIERVENVCRYIDRKVLKTVDYTVTLQYNGVDWTFIMINRPNVGDRFKVRAIDLVD